MDAPREDGRNKTGARRRARLRLAVSILAAAAVGLLGAWMGMLAAGSEVAKIGPFSVRLSSNFGPGETRIALPPFGGLVADTRLAPLTIEASLAEVDALELIDFVRTRSPRQATAEIEAHLLPRIAPFALRLLAVAAIGALGLAVLVFRLDLRSIAVALLAALLVVGGGEALAWRTYRPAALLSPTVSGSFALVPGLLGPVRTAVDRINEFRGELRRIVQGASRVFSDIQESQFGDGDEIAVLHISDVHLSPLGLEFAHEVADAFDVDLVVDTGDLTSFGTPAEDVITSFVARFDQPYFFVRGNHDSLSLQAAVERLPDAAALDGTTAEIEGLLLYGVGDVFFTPDKNNVPDQQEQARLLQSANERVLADLAALRRPPDIVMVHNDREALAAAGRVPLVIAGHDHVPSERTLSGTLFLRVGTTGGSGAGVFSEAGGIPLSAQILYFDRSDRKLVGYDLIEQSPETGNVTVKRNLTGELGGDEEPPPP